MSLVAPSILQGVPQVSPSQAGVQGGGGDSLGVVVFGGEGVSYPYLSKGNVISRHNLKASRGEHLGEFFREELVHL